MHIGLIVDEERLLHERPMLDRLAIGMVDHGAMVTRFVPTGHDQADPEHHEHPVDRVTSRIAVPHPVPRWMRRARARRIAASIERALPDVLYAIGSRAWFIGRDLQEELGTPLVLSLWCQAQTRSLPRWHHQAAGFVVPTAPMAESLSEIVDRDLVSVVAPGVPAPHHPRPILMDPETSIALAIVGTGRDVASYRAMLAALSGVVRDMPQLQAAIELRGAGGHAIWREAQRLGLLPHLSAITDAAPLRTLVTGCDVLVLPERFGEMRSLTLEAMACGMVVIGAHDSALDDLVDDSWALTVDDASPEAWGRQLRRALSDPAAARSIGLAAHMHVRQRHDPSLQVQRLLGTLDKAIGGDSYSFAEAAAGPPYPPKDVPTPGDKGPNNS